MPKKLRAMLPHAAILIANMYIVFFLIDRVNSAMNMLGRDVFKIPFAVFLVLVIIFCVISIVDQRRE